MTTRRATESLRFLLLLAVGVVIVLLAFARNPSAYATSPAVSPALPNYDYKVEFVRRHQDLEGVLQADGRNGWRVHQVLAANYNTDLVVILEKPASVP
jgi:hypothetical protein